MEQTKAGQLVDSRGDGVAELLITEVSPNWFLGRTFGGTFMGYTREEVEGKYRAFVLNRRQHQLAAEMYRNISGLGTTFLERHGYGVGMQVRFHPVIGGRHDGGVWVIQSTGYLPDGEPVVKLQGKIGTVRLAAVSQYLTGWPFSRVAQELAPA